MHCKSVVGVFFSPAGTTKMIVEDILSCMNGERSTVDLLRAGFGEGLTMREDDLLIIGMPVYSGRVHPVCIDQLRKLKGNNTPVIAVVSYGNREYDDALLELCELLEEHGFVTIAAGAFATQHSIFPNVGKQRPDRDDRNLIRVFANSCASYLEAFSSGIKPELHIKGKKPFRHPGKVPVKPDTTKRCNHCGRCSEICPTAAIPERLPQETNKEKCISCAACINICPQNARVFKGTLYMAAKVSFEAKYKARKEPETFLPKFTQV